MILNMIKINSEQMKKYLCITIGLFVAQIIGAQTNPVDALFNKYSEKTGFTSVYISGKMLNMLGGLNDSGKSDGNILLRLKSIRILSEDDSLSTGKVNFFSELGKVLDLSIYEELMVIREGPDITKFLIRQNGESISELLLISGGSGGNSLISIRGDINLKELSELSKTFGIEELEHLEDHDGKKLKK